MIRSVYRRVGRPVEIAGLRSVYGYALILYIVCMMLYLYIFFFLLPIYILIGSSVVLLAAGIISLYRLNSLYGENGITQILAKEKLPKHIVTTRVKNIL